MISARASSRQVFRAYLAWLGGTFATLAAAVIAINWLMNPFGVFQPPALGRVEQPSSAMFTHLRLTKAYAVSRIRPAAVILGSSRAETGLSGSHPGWQTRPVYNLGLSDVKLAEMAHYFEHACAVAPVQEAILLLDYGSSDAPYAFPPGFDTRRLAVVGAAGHTGGWWKDRYDALFTWDALQHSVVTWRGQEGDHVYLNDGSRDNNKEWQRVQGKGGLEVAFAAFETQAKAAKSARPLSRDWMPLRRILQLAAMRNIKLAIVITPYHSRLWKIKTEQDGIDSILSWHRELANICEEEAAKSRLPAFPVWDFSSNKQVCLSPLEIAKESEGSIPFYFESSHFSKRLGDLILDEVLTGRQRDPEFKGVLWSRDRAEDNIKLLAARLHRWQSESLPPTGH